MQLLGYKGTICILIGFYKNILNFRGIYILVYNNPMNKQDICSSCEYNIDDICSKNNIYIQDFIELRLATCPIYKWG